MREIKFRGKRIDNGEWVVGDFYFFEGANIRYYHQTCRHDEGFQNSYTDYEVMLQTVGQFTGLKDKNGKELYKDDMVLWDGRKAIIEWLPRMAGYYAMRKGEGVHFHDMQEIVPSHGGLRHIEIIGNIHDEVKPAVQDSVIINMNSNYIDPKEGQEEVKEDQTAINAAEDQANEALGEPTEAAGEGALVD